ncbi:MAG: hypothetical protein ACRDWI_18470 [Jiangellaceae bacterium]
MTVSFRVKPRGDSTFVLRSRQRQIEREYRVRTEVLGRSRTDVEVPGLAAASQRGSETWDAYVRVAGEDGRIVEVRVGRHRSAVPARARVLTMPRQQRPDEIPVVVTPYYTHYDNLSIRCRRG